MNREQWDGWFGNFKKHLTETQRAGLEDSKELLGAIKAEKFDHAQIIACTIIAGPSHETAATLWIEQSKMLWSRVKVASAIEAGTMYATYKMWVYNECCPNQSAVRFCPAMILLFSIALLVCVCLLMHRDADYLRTFQELAGFQRPNGQFKGAAIGKVAICFLIMFNVYALLWLIVANPIDNM